MRKLPRLGVITASFGRLVDFWVAVELSRSDTYPNRALIKSHLCNTFWSFNAQNEFPFIASRLKGNLRIGGKYYYFLYRMLSKLKVNKLLTHTENVGIDTRKMYDEIDRESILEVKKQLKGSSDLIGKLKDSQVNLNSLCLLYVRSSYWEESRGVRQRNLEVHRNGDLEKIDSIIDYVISLGFSVVRVGRELDSSKSRIGFFDYSTSSAVCDRNDLFLWSKANFAITTHGGANEPAFLFKTPLLLIDFGEYWNLINNIAKIPYLILPKTFRDKTGKKISPSEMQKKGLIFGPARNALFFKEQEITLENCETNECLSAIKDFVDYIRGDETLMNISWSDLGIQVSGGDLFVSKRYKLS